MKGKMVVQSIPHVVKQTVASPKGTPADTTWEKPPAGWAKLNVDGSYVHGENTGGAGMVLRDDTGGHHLLFVSLPSIMSLPDGGGNGSVSRGHVPGAAANGEAPYHRAGLQGGSGRPDG